VCDVECAFDIQQSFIDSLRQSDASIAQPQYTRSIRRMNGPSTQRTWTLCVYFLTALALFAAAACGGGSTPTEPSSPANVNGTWTGSATDSSGPGTMTWRITQSGASFSGSLTITDNSTNVTGRGTVSGSVSGSSLQFSLSVPAGGFDAPYTSCSSTVSGSGTSSSTSITGTYSGSSTGACSTGTIASGQLTLNKQ
jgi:hypothetical protein